MFFCLIGIVFSFLAKVLGIYNGSLFEDNHNFYTLLPYWIFKGTADGLKNIYMNPLWFLVCSFFAAIFLTIISRIKIKIISPLAVIFIVFLGYFVRERSIGCVFNLSVACLCLFYQYLDYCVKLLLNRTEFCKVRNLIKMNLPKYYQQYFLEF